MYLRFVTAEIDRASRVETGVFSAAYDLYYGEELTAYEKAWLRDIFDWFDEYLKEPTRFRRYSRSSRRTGRRSAVCWFKPTAREHLARLHEMVFVLEENGVPVRHIKSPKVGYVVYEDEHQVVAEPVADICF
ncbi:MAG: hypothetical protein JOZ96_07620 [Acidobacteria bacterium]|nr:hypothetical protein [Acidobacteriota bacterium]